MVRPDWRATYIVAEGFGTLLGRDSSPSSGRIVEANFRWDPDYPGAPATDYDRACDIIDYLGVLTVGPGYALVLDDEPMPTTWLASETGASGLLARWWAGESEEKMEQHLRSAPEKLFNVPVDLTVTFVSTPLLLFDAPITGSEILSGAWDHIKLDLPAGEYEVRTVQYEPDEENILILYKLSLSAG